MSDKFEKFGFEEDFFDVAVLDGMVNNTPHIPKNMKQAHDDGFMEGLAQGRAEGENLLQQELRAFRQQIANLTTQLTRQHEQWEKALTTYALSLLRVSIHRLMGHAAEHYSDQMLEHHLRNLITLLHQGDGLTLRINPQARTYHEKLELPQASIANLPFRIATDPSLGLTDVVIEWAGGGLESKLTDHLAALDELLAATGAQPLPVPELPTSSNLPSPPEDPHPLTTAQQQSHNRAAELLGNDDLVDALK